MKYLIEVRDAQDKNSTEPWSHFQACTELTLSMYLGDLADYLKKYDTVCEVRIIIEK